MANEDRTGSRIRARRLAQGLKQATLAQAAGISPSYLNLIEHNRRRIGGAILLRLAEALRTTPEVLADGAEAALIAQLQHAAAGSDAAQPELDHVDEFTGHYPGWAGLVAEQAARIAHLEHGLHRLSDRMTHDPHLAEALHDLLSTITSIRSTAGILAETGDLTPEWRARFDRNIHEDSRRLSEASQSLVAYLDAATPDATSPALSALDEVAHVFVAQDYHFPELEESGAAAVPDVMARIGADLGREAARLVARRLAQVAADCEAVPLADLVPAVARFGVDPVALGRALAVDAGTLLRRLAHLPGGALPEPVGLVICDAGGAVVHRRDLPDFTVPRYDAPCARWPLYEALGRPGVPIQRSIVMATRDGRALDAFAVAQPLGVNGFDRGGQVEAVMLVRAATDREADAGLCVGPTCRLCAHADCAARRSPSLVVEEGAFQ